MQPAAENSAAACSDHARQNFGCYDSDDNLNLLEISLSEMSDMGGHVVPVQAPSTGARTAQQHPASCAAGYPNPL
eukprot:COSAG01_NODE_60452_length_294_cov_2.348718_1_plen_74_part_10